jgi:hypothetical protein
MSESAPSTRKAKALTAEWPGQKPKEMVSVASNAKDRELAIFVCSVLIIVAAESESGEMHGAAVDSNLSSGQQTQNCDPPRHRCR